MITLNLLQYIENAGLGEIDESLFWERMPVDVEGVYISDLGNSTTRGGLKEQSYELYARFNNNVEGYRRLNDILKLLDSSFNVCRLPEVVDCKGNVLAPSVNGVSIMPTSSITNYGADDRNRIIYSAQGSIYY
mgnify:CR=1 FL=1